MSRPVAVIKAEALREAADALVVYANDVFYRDDSPFHSAQRWALGDTAATWLRERAALTHPEETP